MCVNTSVNLSTFSQYSPWLLFTKNKRKKKKKKRKKLYKISKASSRLWSRERDVLSHTELPGGSSVTIPALGKANRESLSFPPGCWDLRKQGFLSVLGSHAGGDGIDSHLLVLAIVAVPFC